ncbi:MAG: hypothetical protein Q4G34_09860 [Micrococcus sp.]|nr:hypothetical protein [Micrococcus sp.]
MTELWWSVTGWAASLLLLALVVAGFVSLMRGPLDERRRLVWVATLLILPGLGSLIWFWWHYRYYPARRAEQPEWDPNSRVVPVTPPRRSSLVGARGRYGAQDDPHRRRGQRY